MKNYMIYNTLTGTIKGFYDDNIWEYENILKDIRESEELKEISTDLWNLLIGNNENYIFNVPKIKNIKEFMALDTVKCSEDEFILYIEEDTSHEDVPYEANQLEKDVAFIAQSIKTIIEPIKLIPELQESTSILEGLTNIINRYT